MISKENDEINVDVYIPTDESASKILKYKGKIYVPENLRTSDYVKSSNDLKIYLPENKILHIEGSFVLVPHDEEHHKKITADGSAVYERNHMQEESIILKSLLNNFEISGKIGVLGRGDPTKQKIWIVSNAEMYVAYFDEGDKEEQLKVPVAIIRPWKNYILKL